MASVPVGERRENRVLLSTGMLIQPLDEGEVARGFSKPKRLQIRVGKVREKK